MGSSSFDIFQLQTQDTLWTHGSLVSRSQESGALGGVPSLNWPCLGCQSQAHVRLQLLGSVRSCDHGVQECVPGTLGNGSRVHGWIGAHTQTRPASTLATQHLSIQMQPPPYPLWSPLPTSLPLIPSGPLCPPSCALLVPIVRKVISNLEIGQKDLLGQGLYLWLIFYWLSYFPVLQEQWLACRFGSIWDVSHFCLVEEVTSKVTISDPAGQELFVSSQAIF